MTDPGHIVMRAAIRSGNLDVDGGTLHYEVAGPDDGVAIVFIHGGFGASARLSAA